MPEVTVAAAVPGPAAAVLELWDDPRRWPGFVDGFKAVKRQDDRWPEAGSSIVWTTGPHGVGHTREIAVAPGVREIENEQLKGTLSAVYADGDFVVGLQYELKQRTPYALFFVRRALRDALRRTVERFAIERRADADML